MLLGYMKEMYFTETLRTNVDLTPEQMEILCQGSRTIEVARGEFLLSRGEMCKHRFFIERGAVREYYIDERGREHLLLFATEGYYLMSVDSVLMGLPSSYFIQAIEDTRVLMLDDEQVRRLVASDPAFEQYERSLLHEHIQMLQRRIISLISGSAQERYLEFVQLYPEVMLRVPQTMVASFLGITPESLSRIRHDLARGHQARKR